VFYYIVAATYTITLSHTHTHIITGCGQQRGGKGVWNFNKEDGGLIISFCFVFENRGARRLIKTAMDGTHGRSVLPRALPSGHHRTVNTCPSPESGRISKWLPSPASESYSNSIRIKSNHYHGHSSLPVKYRKLSTKLIVRVSYSDRIQLKSSFRLILLPDILISNTGPKNNRNIECHRPSGQLTPIELRKVSFQSHRSQVIL